jgi:hypothetical protein
MRAIPQSPGHLNPEVHIGAQEAEAKSFRYTKAKRTMDQSAA